MSVSLYSVVWSDFCFCCCFVYCLFFLPKKILSILFSFLFLFLSSLLFFGFIPLLDAAFMKKTQFASPFVMSQSEQWPNQVASVVFRPPPNHEFQKVAKKGEFLVEAGNRGPNVPITREPQTLPGESSSPVGQSS